MKNYLKFSLPTKADIKVESGIQQLSPSWRRIGMRAKSKFSSRIKRKNKDWVMKVV